MTLDELKEIRYTEIDQVTETMIRRGFTFGLFPGSLFSMSDTAQINWTNFPNLPDSVFEPDGLHIMSTTEVLCLLPLAQKMNFYYSALAFKNGFLQSGSVLKEEIKACQTIAEVNAIVDNRYIP